MGLNGREQHFFVDDIKEIDICGKKGYQILGSSYSKPTEFKRLSYENHNLDNCEQCRITHANIVERIGDRFKNFPMCCELHRNLLKAVWFDRKHFEDTPKLYADKLLYTYHHVINYIDQENWQDEIFDYIEYVLNTFGSFPINFGEPLFFKSFTEDLSSLIRGAKLSESKKEEILKFIATFLHRDKSKKSDFNIALNTYNEWFRTFPFELSFFGSLEEYFAKNIPIMESIHVNKYLGLAKARPASKDTLVKRLLKITDTIIRQINTSTLYEQGLLVDIEKSETELILQERKQKLKAGYLNNSKDPDTRYRKILKEWLRDELAFIKKIRPIFERASRRVSSLFEALLFACQKMQENKIFWMADENTRTRQVLDLLSSSYFTKDQSLYGQSESGKKQGEVDGVILDGEGTEHFIEAFNLDSLDNGTITKHINKLELNYDAKGLLRKYVLVYCNIEDGTFGKFRANYLEYLKSSMNFKFLPTDFELIHTKYTNIEVIKSFHDREGRSVELIHVLIKMPAK